MARLLIYVRRHWQALLVVSFFIWRLWQNDFSSRMWIAAGFAVVGLVMNLVVNLVNGGMPAQVTLDQIPDEARPNYQPISQSTRLAWLSDWIPVGNLLMSPGDVALLIAVGLLLLGTYSGF